MIARILIVLLICCLSGRLFASSASDLSSPSQEVRDAAGAILRPIYTATPRANWESVVKDITKGMTKGKVLELLSPFKVTSEGGFGSGGSYSESYRLDDAWVLTCWFLNDGDTLIERELSASLRNVWVEAPTNFTGVWITYFVNGQKSHEIHYRDGKYHGELIAYRSDGSKCFVQHYDHHVAQGDDTGFYASGRINYRGVYKAGKQVGTWIWFNEDGSTKLTRDYSKP